MRILIFGISLLLFSNSLIAQADAHKRALKYYVQLTNNAKESYLSMSNTAQFFSDYFPIASETKNFTLDSLRIDSLSKSFSTLISTLESNIISLDSLKEVDLEIDFKSTVISIYKEAIPAFNRIIPKFITIFKSGYKISSKEEISKYWSEYQNSMKSIEEKIDVLGKKNYQFLTKYNIQDEELKENGL